MDDLRTRNLDQWLKNTTKPVLGICLGMQLLFESSEEGESVTLGRIPGRLQKFDAGKGKVPHMGWNRFESKKDHPLLNGIDVNHFFYYVHGYYAPVNEYTLATCHYIRNFSAVVAKDNFMGVQFHPEKSGQAGSLLLQNFLQMVDGTGDQSPNARGRILEGRQKEVSLLLHISNTEYLQSHITAG